MIPLKKPLPGNLPDPQPESQSPQSADSIQGTPASPGDSMSSAPVVATLPSRKGVTTFIIVMVVIIGLAFGIYFLFVKEKKSGWEDDLNEWDTEYVDSYYEDY